MYPSTAGLLVAGEGLYPDEALYSADGYLLAFQNSDGNLVIYQLPEWNAPWATGVVKPESWPGVLVMQGDGNLVIYDTAGEPVWDSGTWNHLGAYFVLESGVGTIYDASGQSVLWSRP